MARLTTAERKKLPAKDFAGPGRSYPVEDKGHAMAAKARAAEFASPPERSRIDAKADRVIDRNKNRTADRVVARISKPTKPK